MTFTQADWTPGSDARRRLFAFVVQALNDEAGAPDFMVQDDVSGPLIRHIPTEVRIGLRPSLPANDAKPFDIWVRLTHRFPMKADGSFNVKKVVRRVLEVGTLKLPEVP